jgi:hypothetical protein
MEDAENYELEEYEKSYPKYDNMDYSDLQSSFDDLTNRLQRDVRYGSDPLVTTDLNNELSYVRKTMGNWSLNNYNDEMGRNMRRMFSSEED